MGGQRETFLTTHWSLIEEVKKQPDQDRALIGLLLHQQSREHQKIWFS